MMSRVEAAPGNVAAEGGPACSADVQTLPTSFPRERCAAEQQRHSQSATPRPPSLSSANLPTMSPPSSLQPIVSTTLSDQDKELAAALNDTPAPAPRDLVSRMRHACAEFFSYYSLFFVVFFTVLREGMEAAVFLFGVGNADPVSIPISGLIGVLCGVMVGVVLYYTGRSVRTLA